MPRLSTPRLDGPRPRAGGYVKIAGWATATRRHHRNGSRHGRRRDARVVVEGPARRRLRNPAALALRRLRLPHADRGRGPGDPGRVPDGLRAAPDVPRGPDGRRRRARGHRRRGPRLLARGPVADGRDPRRRDVGPHRFGGLLRALPARPQGASLEGPEPPARLDHRPRRAALRPRGHQVHDHDRVLLLGQRDGLRLRRDRGGPRRRRRHRRLGRARAPDLRRLQLAAVGGSRSLPPVRPRPQGPLDRRGRRDHGLRGGGARAPPRRSGRRGVPRLRRHLATRTT